MKRDKWIWSGDAYQSFFVNRYLMADADIDQRTILALRGNDPMTKHINTIVDYSLLWLLGVDYHNEGYGDREFLELVYPKMCSLMEFCNGRRDEHGFLIGKEKTGYILTGRIWTKTDRSVRNRCFMQHVSV